jgi:multiple sugar transport system ATP-binding protein
MASIRLEDVTKKYGKNTALANLSFEVDDGEFFCILGPPGAGKTTTLRTIIGLESPDGGGVYIEGERVNEVHPSQRDIAMIFQNLALYPDKTIFENIASPLRRLKLDKKEIETKVHDVARQLRIDWLLTKTPGQLSGGERQRVAIGRAIVRQPRAYLMDEPLSNLDALLRLEMRLSLKELQTELKETFVYATHDQAEALSMADRIAILDRGLLQQLGSPEAVYRQPENRLVATVLGNPSMNFLECTLEEDNDRLKVVHEAFSVGAEKAVLGKALESLPPGSKDVVLGIRPEDVTIYHEKPEGQSIDAEIYVIEPLGNKTIVDIKVGEDVIKVIDKPSYIGEPGEKAWLQIREAKSHLFDKDSSRCLFHASTETPLRLN